MNYLLQQSRLQHLIKNRNGYLVLASGSVVLNIILALALFLMIGHERIIVVPPSINKTFWVSANHVSPEYLSEMSLFFVSLRFNVTPSNVVHQRDLLLKYTDPKQYASLKIELNDEAARLNKGRVTTAFHPVDIKVDAQKLQARVTGDIQSTVGGVLLPMQRVTYQIQFTYNQGRLLVNTFQEVKKNA